MCRCFNNEIHLFIEKATAHNKLLHEIQSGIRLKPVKTNDRSKPILDGLRKFRRQMTIEEQLIKSESKAVVFAEKPQPEAEEEDELDALDDIDKLRDDLQSTKQMLALELRNKEFQERENKRLLTRVQNLEAELARERWNPMDSTSPQEADESLMASLKRENTEVQKTCKELEDKFNESATQLDKAKNTIEEQKLMIAQLERRIQVRIFKRLFLIQGGSYNNAFTCFLIFRFCNFILILNRLWLRMVGTITMYSTRYAINVKTAD